MAAAGASRGLIVYMTPGMVRTIETVARSAIVQPRLGSDPLDVAVVRMTSIAGESADAIRSGPLAHGDRR
jgi:hypothetical protein